MSVILFVPVFRVFLGLLTILFSHLFLYFHIRRLYRRHLRHIFDFQRLDFWKDLYVNQFLIELFLALGRFCRFLNLLVEKCLH